MISEGEEFSEGWEDQMSLIEEEFEIAPFGNVPSDYLRTGFGLLDIPTTGKKRDFDPRIISLKQMQGLLFDFPYMNIQQYTERAFDFVKRLPNDRMILYNIDTLTAASLYTVMYQRIGGVNKRNIAAFLKETEGLNKINHLDFIRYIRALENIYIW